MSIGFKLCQKIFSLGSIGNITGTINLIGQYLNFFRKGRLQIVEILEISTLVAGFIHSFSQSSRTGTAVGVVGCYNRIEGSGFPGCFDNQLMFGICISGEGIYCNNTGNTE